MVFISYSRSDSEFVDRLKLALEKRQFEVWLDRADILPGQRIVSELSKAINSADAFIFILSFAANQSRWTEMEYELAIFQATESSQRIPLIPVLIEPVPVQAGFLKIRQSIDFTKATFDSAIEKLCLGLIRKATVPGPVAAPHGTERYRAQYAPFRCDREKEVKLFKQRLKEQTDRSKPIVWVLPGQMQDRLESLCERLPREVGEWTDPETNVVVRSVGSLEALDMEAEGLLDAENTNKIVAFYSLLPLRQWKGTIAKELVRCIVTRSANQSNAQVVFFLIVLLSDGRLAAAWDRKRVRKRILDLQGAWPDLIIGGRPSEINRDDIVKWAFDHSYPQKLRADLLRDTLKGARQVPMGQVEDELMDIREGTK